MVEPKVEPIKISDEEQALARLNQRPETFRWTINDAIFTRDALVATIKAGAAIVALAKDLTSLGDGNISNQLGKRYRCLVCGTEILATKAGPGRASCCEQDMETQNPKPVPSSD